MTISASNIRCPSSTTLLVPRNFTGAMENWGGVIYSERALLFDEATGSGDDRKVVHEYVVHELAHQWFGNLVTMGGGTTCGSMKALPLGWKRSSPTSSIRR